MEEKLEDTTLGRSQAPQPVTGHREALTSHAEKGAHLRGVLAKQLDSSPVVWKPPDKAEGRDGPQAQACVQVPGGHKESWRGRPQARGAQGPTAGVGPAMTCCVPKAVGPGKRPHAGEVEGHGRLELWQNKKF